MLHAFNERSGSPSSPGLGWPFYPDSHLFDRLSSLSLLNKTDEGSEESSLFAKRGLNYFCIPSDGEDTTDAVCAMARFTCDCSNVSTRIKRCCKSSFCFRSSAFCN